MAETAGLTRDELLVRLLRQLDATKLITAIKDGEITDSLEVPDNIARQHGLRMAFELANEFPAKQLDIRSHVRVEELHEVALQLASVPVEQLHRIIDATPLALEPAEAEAAR